MTTKILNSELPLYRRLFQIDWPKHIVTCGLLDHFIDRFQKFPEWEEKVQFLKLNNSEINDATFVFINGPHVYFDTLESGPFEKLSALMNKLDYSHEIVFIGIRDIFRPFVHDLIRIQNLEKTFDTGTKCIYANTNFSDETIKEIEKICISKIPKGFYHDSLKEKDAKIMSSVWAQKYSGSENFLKTAIKMNPSTGIYKDDGELIAWNIFLETGAGGNLQVKEGYQHKDFATIVTYLQHLKVLKMGRTSFGHIGHQNDISLNFIKKHLGECVVGYNSWIGIRKRPKSDYLPLWGHL